MDHQAASSASIAFITAVQDSVGHPRYLPPFKRLATTQDTFRRARHFPPLKKETEFEASCRSEQSSRLKTDTLCCFKTETICRSTYAIQNTVWRSKYYLPPYRSRHPLSLKTLYSVQDTLCRSRHSLPFKTPSAVRDTPYRSRCSLPFKTLYRSRHSMPLKTVPAIETKEQLTRTPRLQKPSLQALTTTETKTTSTKSSESQACELQSRPLKSRRSWTPTGSLRQHHCCLRPSLVVDAASGP